MKMEPNSKFNYQGEIFEIINVICENNAIKYVEGIVCGESIILSYNECLAHLTSTYSTHSQHLILDIWLNSEITETLLESIKQLIQENFTIVQKNSHKFEPQGETIVFILSESHFTVHTYPEHNYLSIDIYICNMNKDMERVKTLILEKCDMKDHKYQVLNRGFEF